MNDEAARLVERLRLDPLPHEGGFFRRIWTAPAPADGSRPAASAILFLLTSSDFSALHQLTTEELWLHQAGDPVEHIQLLPGHPAPVRTTLHSPAVDVPPPCRSPLSRGVPEGRGVEASSPDASFTVTIPPGVWQGARLLPAATPQPLDTPPTPRSPSPLLRAMPEGRGVSAASVPARHGWSLITCVVTPAWSDADFTLGDRSALLREFPSARDWILALTR